MLNRQAKKKDAFAIVFESATDLAGLAAKL